MFHAYQKTYFFTSVLLIICILIIASIFLSGRLYSLAMSNFKEVTDFHSKQNTETLCALGEEIIEYRLSTLLSEVSRLASSKSSVLSDCKDDILRMHLATMVLQDQECDEEFFYIPQIKSSAVFYGQTTQPLLAEKELESVWAGSPKVIGPVLERTGAYSLYIFAPCFWSGTVRGVLGVRLHGAILSRWINLFRPDPGGGAYLLDARGVVLARSAGTVAQWTPGSFNLLQQPLEFVPQAMKELHAYALTRQQGTGSYYAWQGTKETIVAYRALHSVPWRFFVSLDTSALLQGTGGTVSTNLSNMMTLYYLLLSILCIMIVLLLFEGWHYRCMNRDAAEKNSIILQQANDLAAVEKMFRFALSQKHYKIINYDTCSQMLTCHGGDDCRRLRIASESNWIDALIDGKRIPESVRREFTRLVADVLHGKQRDTCQLHLYDSSGTDFWYRFSLSSIGGTLRNPARLIGVLEDISRAKEAEYDSLTRLYNKKTSEKLIMQRLEDLTPEQSFGFILLDIDFFKQINDTCGHPVGDEMLIWTAGLLRRTFRREQDILGRLGGDEFCVFLTGANLDCARIAMGLEQIRHEAQFSGNDARSAVTFSCGAVFGSCGASFCEIYERADKALYRVKERGRNNFELIDLKHNTLLASGDPVEPAETFVSSSQTGTTF